jgi:predicted nucleic acid-binding Zn ribbon protein
MSSGSKRDDPDATTRRARNLDRDERVYERRRWSQARQRAKLERDAFDPAPPTEDDWVTAEEDTDGLRRVRPPSAVGDTLERFVDQRGWSERLQGTRVFTHWSEVVGADLVPHCEPVRVAGGTLVVRAASQVWATQLRYLTPAMLGRANEVLGAGTVRDVRIVVGALTGTEEDA